MSVWIELLHGAADEAEEELSPATATMVQEALAQLVLEARERPELLEAPSDHRDAIERGAQIVTAAMTSGINLGEREIPQREGKLKKSAWVVVDVSDDYQYAQEVVAPFIASQHYTGTSGGPPYAKVFGLYLRERPDVLLGASWWRPPMANAAKRLAGVCGCELREVVELVRMAIDPSVPRNGATFVIGAAIKKIKREKQYKGLLSFADSFRGHEGAIYKATNWKLDPVMSKRERVWTTPLEGDPSDPFTWTMVAKKQHAVTRRVGEMERLGYVTIGVSQKFRFYLCL